MVIGITGGIGSGKSTIGRAVELLDYPLYVSDNWANWLMNSDSDVRRSIISCFGSECYLADGLNRAYLASTVFGDRSKLSELESIVHPAVFRHFEEFVAEFDSKQLIFVESAILFESGFDRYCDKVITISANEQLRISRVISRDSSNRDAVARRISAQMSDSERESRSDYTINCDEHHSALQALLSIIDELTLN